MGKIELQKYVHTIFNYFPLCLLSLISMLYIACLHVYNCDCVHVRCFRFLITSCLDLIYTHYQTCVLNQSIQFVACVKVIIAHSFDIESWITFQNGFIKNSIFFNFYWFEFIQMDSIKHLNRITWINSFKLWYVSNGSNLKPTFASWPSIHTQSLPLPLYSFLETNTL